MRETESTIWKTYCNKDDSSGARAGNAHSGTVDPPKYTACTFKDDIVMVPHGWFGHLGIRLLRKAILVLAGVLFLLFIEAVAYQERKGAMA